MDDKLIKYRIGSGVSTSIYKIREALLRCVRLEVDSLKQFESDIKAFKESNKTDIDWLLGKLSARNRYLKNMNMLLTNKKFGERLSAFRDLVSAGKYSRLSPLYFQMVCYLMPYFIGEPLLRIYATLNYMRRLVFAR